MDAADLVSAVKTQGGFDVDDDTALSWVNEAYRDAVARSGWREQVVSLGTTVSGTSKYEVDDTYVSINSIKVGGARYTLNVSVEEIWDLQSGASQFRSGRQADGAFAEAFDDTDTRFIELYPTPTSSGSAISAFITALPDSMTLSMTPILPLDLHSMLISGAIAIGLEWWSERPDLATPHNTKFEARVEELRRRANSRVGGSTAQRMRVAGYDF